MPDRTAGGVLDAKGNAVDVVKGALRAQARHVGSWGTGIMLLGEATRAYDEFKRGMPLGVAVAGAVTRSGTSEGFEKLGNIFGAAAGSPLGAPGAAVGQVVGGVISGGLADELDVTDAAGNTVQNALMECPNAR